VGARTRPGGEVPKTRMSTPDAFDDAITALLARNPTPFFVQVGGYDGVSFDPLRPHVVEHDLSGLIVEPIPQYFDKLSALYAGSQRVKPVNCAVAEEDGERTIWRFNPEAVERGLLPPHFGGISSFLMEDLLADTGVLGRSSPNAETTLALRQLVQAVPVQARTLDTLLAEHGVERVDILQIDTEGYDLNVLRLFDFARFRPSVVHYEHQHLNAQDRAIAETLLRDHGYRIRPQDYDTLAVLDGEGARTAKLRELAVGLQAEGRTDDAALLLEHLADLRPDDRDTLIALARLQGAQGRPLDALKTLLALRAIATDVEGLLTEVREQAGPAIARFNAHRDAGEIAEAERYAAALAALAPQNEAMVSAALSCNQALGRTSEVARYATLLLAVDPNHVVANTILADQCKERGDVEGEIRHRGALALSPATELHPLLRLRDLYNAASVILCGPLDLAAQGQLEVLLAAARGLSVESEPGSEWSDWEKHYRLMLDGVDLAAVRGPTPALRPEPEVLYATATGAPLDAAAVRARADKLGAKAVFFAAADESYVDLYARWYGLSVLKHSDVPCLVVVQVIGGKDRLAEIAARVGIDDERLVFAADGFDGDSVTTECRDAPPKGLSARPIAHFQSVRFQRLGALLALVDRPVFVSDIDLLLQRGVADLLERFAAVDVAFNENELSRDAGSRLTANLVMLRPTANAQTLLAFLRAYLDDALAGRAVTRWVDQLALLLARHHLLLRGEHPQIGYFDTASDINNVMYPSYQEHPFRFLSLYHGFDTSSLEGDPRVLGEPAAKPTRRTKT
jgi:FkbM family methyltransferase